MATSATAVNVLTLPKRDQAIAYSNRDAICRHPDEIGKKLAEISVVCNNLVSKILPEIKTIFIEIRRNFSTTAPEAAKFGTLALNAVIEKKSPSLFASSQDARYGKVLQTVKDSIGRLQRVETAGITLARPFSTRANQVRVITALNALQYGPRDGAQNLGFHQAEANLETLLKTISEIQQDANTAKESIADLFLGNAIQGIGGAMASFMLEQLLLENIYYFKGTKDTKYLQKIIDKAGDNLEAILRSIVDQHPELISVIRDYYTEQGLDKDILVRVIVARDELEESEDEFSSSESEFDDASVSSHNPATVDRGHEEEQYTLPELTSWFVENKSRTDLLQQALDTFGEAPVVQAILEQDHTLAGDIRAYYSENQWPLDSLETIIAAA